MTVSVIIPCFNGEPYVAKAIESVLAQRVAGLKLIVVDDGSTDKSAIIVEQFSNVTLIRQSNKGVSVARNTGANVATGSFLLFLDADDRLKDGAIEAHLAAFAKDERRVMTFGACDVIDHRGRFLRSNPQPERTYDYWDVMLGVTPNPSQCLLKRDVFDRVGGFNENIRYGEDWDLFMRMSRFGDVFCHGMVVAEYRKHDAQSTRRPSKTLTSMLDIIETHMLQHDGNRDEAKKFRTAKVHYARFLGKWIPSETLKHLRGARYRSAFDSAAVFFRHLPDSAHGLPELTRTLLRRRQAETQGPSE